MKDLFYLFYIFAKMGAVNFGGGYAMLPLIQQEVVEKNGWATTQEVQDYFAVGQCTPGVISANVATFVGYKVKGILGGFMATLGFTFPSIIIITIIASILTNFADYQVVKDAFAAINVCVFLLVLKAIISMFPKSIVDFVALLIFLGVFFLSIFTHISPVLFVFISAFIGIVTKLITVKRMESRRE